ncbi:hypothetical protein CE91St32_18320 [Gordonibacter pamelaeae]|nr:hypothetical protein CE91St32_18320 [Gordonibacter pamelaeae]
MEGGQQAPSGNRLGYRGLNPARQYSRGPNRRGNAEVRTGARAATRTHPASPLLPADPGSHASYA